MARGPQHRQHGTQGVKGRVQVQVQHALPGGVIGLVDRLPARESAHQVNQGVQAAGVAAGALDRGGGLFRRGEIGRDGKEARVGDRWTARAGYASDDRARIQERLADGAAQPSARAGD